MCQEKLRRRAPMNILLFGKMGQVGWELQRSLTPLGKVVALDVSSEEYCGDFSNPAGIAQTVRKINPDVIVNAAAHTAVDRAESEPEIAQLLNATCVEAIAKEASRIGSWVVHYSTDYVFPGTGIQAWNENDLPKPLNIYGKSKLDGEIALQQYCSKYLIFRTSWVYATRGANFAKTMLRLAKEKEKLSIINDQFGAPTGAELLADATAIAIRTAVHNQKLFGTYHLVASGETTWFDYAQYVFSIAKELGETLSIKEVIGVDTSAYPTPAKRPHNSRLSNKKFQTAFEVKLPDWKVGVKRVVTEILGK